jgi:hypothetical protein
MKGEVYSGGKAFLFVEDQMAPYTSGVLFKPTPPNKRSVYEVD